MVTYNNKICKKPETTKYYVLDFLLDKERLLYFIEKHSKLYFIQILKQKQTNKK